MNSKPLVTTFVATLIVAALATVWAIASPLTASCASATPIQQISPASSETSQFVSHVNELRRSRGLSALAVEGNLTSVAQEWAVNMAANDGIFHRSDLRDGITIDWARLGENVGMGQSVPELMQAFILSPGHLKNLVDPTFTHIGIGTARTPNGLLFTAHEFAAVRGVAVSAPVTAPRPAVPRAITPRVTSPPVADAQRVTVPPPAPTTTTTEPPVVVQRSTAKKNQLQDGGADDHQKQKNKNERRCRAHSDLRVVV